MITISIILMKDNTVIDMESFITFDSEPEESKRKTKDEITKAFKRMAASIGGYSKHIDSKTDYFCNTDTKEAVQKVSVSSNIFMQRK